LLRTAVIALRLAPDVQQGLLDKLDAAKQSIQASQSTIACNQLNAFANQAKAQTKKAVADGTNLLTRQNEVEAALDCVKSTAPPAEVTVTAPAGSSTAPVDFSVSASDNVAVRSIVCDPRSGTPFAYGLTTVTCTATDTSGNTATGTFKVTVNFAISGRITDRD